MFRSRLKVLRETWRHVRARLRKVELYWIFFLLHLFLICHATNLEEGASDWFFIWPLIATSVPGFELVDAGVSVAVFPWTLRTFHEVAD